jgi:hypothetical protein
MEITLNIADELARQVTPERQDPARVAQEALALEGDRTELLLESAVRQMLGFETRMEVHAFLKQHRVYLHCDLTDLEQDQGTGQNTREKLRSEKASGKQRLEQSFSPTPPRLTI